MKSLLKFGLPIAASLLTGTVAGIVLQKYGDISSHIGDLLRSVGLYHYAYSAVSPIQTATQTEAVPTAYQGQLRLYVLAGQSNMTGLAELPEKQSIHPQIFTFGNNYRWQPAQEPVDSPLGQVDTVSLDPEAGFGPSLAFARAMLADNPDWAIGLIPCAKGGSSIADWQRDRSDQTLYGSCLKRIQAASTLGELSGFLFFQGEADAVDPKDYPSLRPAPDAWADKFSQLASDLRSDLAQPALPIVYAQLGSISDPESFPGWQTVQAQQAQVQLPHTVMITTTDLALKDAVHFNRASFEVIGERFAQGFEQLNQPSKQPQ
ncbi:MAG: sialate O-acetylesterase [Cyanobacteria bacterium P01_A01_bin.114]